MAKKKTGKQMLKAVGRVKGGKTTPAQRRAIIKGNTQLRREQDSEPDRYK